MISRGEDAEITTYLEKAHGTEMAGNVVDLCPVGALTHKPWAFNYRPWELKKTETIDVHDAVGANVRVDARGAEVVRVLPRASAAKMRKVDPSRIGVIAGDLQDAESMKAAMDLFKALGSANIDCRQDGMTLGYGPRESWLISTTLAGIEQADGVMLIGTNPRLEAPLLNARLRKSWLAA